LDNHQLPDRDNDELIDMFEQFIGYKPTKEYWWQGKYPSRFDNIK